VRIDGQPPQRLGVAIVRAPRLADRDEELLILGEPVGDVGLVGAGAQLPVGQERVLDTAEIGDVLAERELAVDRLAGGAPRRC